MRIDAHVHLYDPTRLELSWPPKGDVFYRRFEMPEFLKATRDTPVDGAVVVACSPETKLMDEFAARYRDEKRVVALIGQVEDAEDGFDGYYSRYRMEEKFRGLRISARTQVTPALIQSVRAMAGERARVLEVLGDWDDMGHLMPLIEAAPGVTFVLEHFAGISLTGEALPPEYLRFLKEMAAYDNVQMKLSALMTRSRAEPVPLRAGAYEPLIGETLAAFGTDRCLFGSDWPVMSVRCDYRRAIDLTEEILQGYGEEVREDVMARNAVRLYGID